MGNQIASTSANSIVGKMDELKLKSKDCDIIGIVKTWSNDSITDNELAMNGFNMFITDKKESNGIGGNLILYIKGRCHIIPTYQATISLSHYGAQFG